VKPAPDWTPGAGFFLALRSADDMFMRKFPIVMAVMLLGVLAPAYGQPAPTRKPLQLYDWMMFNKQPDLRPLGYQPVFAVEDATYNRSTVPEDQNQPGVEPDYKNETNPLRLAKLRSDQEAKSLFAARRQARAAIGVEPLPQDQWDRPDAYDTIVRDVVFDLEGANWVKGADQLQSTSRQRIRTIDIMCQHFDEMKKEAKFYGKDLRIGAYMPISWIGQQTWTGDPSYPAYDKAGAEDWRPWADRVDFVAPDLSFHDEDVQKNIDYADKMIKECKRLVPGKPVIAEFQLVYAHGMPDGNPKKWTLVPLADFTKYVLWLARNPDVDGLMIFGTAALGIDNSDASGQQDNGTFRSHYRHVEPYVKLVPGIVKIVNRERLTVRPAPATQPTTAPTSQPTTQPDH
jgi:hypothetical protein